MGAAPLHAAAWLLARAVGEGICPREAPDSPRGFSGGWPQELDVAVYWYGAGGRRERAGHGGGPSGRYYDPSRHTLIYVHGWEGGHGGTTSRCHRASPTCHVGLCPEGEDLAEPWIRRGWNVGYFYWDQFADEPCPRDAEHKIWRDSNNTEEGMRWLGYDERGEVDAHFFRSDGVSVAELCMQAIATAVPAPGAGAEVRLVGHSIGAQLVARCADLLHRQGLPAAPQRIALLEPYFTLHVWFPFRCDSTNMSDGFGLTVASRTAELVERLAREHGVVTEVWKSSMLTENRMFGVPNSALENEGVYVELVPTWCGTPAMEYLECRHGAAYAMYFRSGAEGSTEARCPVPMPKCATELMPHYIGSRWTQTSGLDTYATDDDSFVFAERRVNASNESFLRVPEGQSPRSVAASLLGLPAEDGSWSSWPTLLGAALLLCTSLALACCGRALCTRTGPQRSERMRALHSAEGSDGEPDRNPSGSIAYAGEEKRRRAADHAPLLGACVGTDHDESAFYLCGGDSEEESDEEQLTTVTPVPDVQLAGQLPPSSARKQPVEATSEPGPQSPNLLLPSPPHSFQSAHELHSVGADGRVHSLHSLHSLQASMSVVPPNPTPRLLDDTPRVRCGIP